MKNFPFFIANGKLPHCHSSWNRLYVLLFLVAIGEFLDTRLMRNQEVSKEIIILSEKFQLVLHKRHPGARGKDKVSVISVKKTISSNRNYSRLSIKLMTVRLWFQSKRSLLLIVQQVCPNPLTFDNKTKEDFSPVTRPWYLRKKRILKVLKNKAVYRFCFTNPSLKP